MKSWVLHRVAGRSDLPPRDSRHLHEPDLDVDAAPRHGDAGAASDPLRAGDSVQPAWGRFTDRIAGYGLPTFPRVRHLRVPGPLATLVVAYRS